jgi:hypothetical protein
MRIEDGSEQQTDEEFEFNVRFPLTIPPLAVLDTQHSTLADRATSKENQNLSNDSLPLSTQHSRRSSARRAIAAGRMNEGFCADS